MVYRKLLIVTGVILTREQLYEALFCHGVDMKEQDPSELEELVKLNILDEAPEKKNFECRGGLKLFQFPSCCSANSGKFFLLGYEIHAFYRKHVQCSDCEEHSVCELCIGETSGGWYDVQKILDGPVEVPREKMCYICHSDKVGTNGRCDLCFINNKGHEDRRDYQEKHLRTFVRKNFVPEGEIKVANYYMVDDCLSCT